MSELKSAIEHIGLSALARRFGFYPSAVQKWRDSRRLPASDLLGLTDYAGVIEEMSGGKYSAEKIRAETREQWEKNPPRKPGGRRRNAKAA